MTDEVIETGGTETAPIVDVEDAAVQAAAALKAADEAKAKEQAELDLQAKQEEDKKPDDSWKDKELKKKHAQIKERDRELEAVRAKLKELEDEKAARARQEDPPRDPDNGRFVATQQINREEDIKAEAAKIVAANQFAADCKSAEDKGRETYKEDFDKAVENLQMKGGFDEATLRGILATDDPSKVLYELGRNPAEYDRIMGLSYERRIAEMTKISTTPAPKPKVSEAPAPTEPVGGRGGASNAELRDDMNDSDWYATRDRQSHERWLKKNGRAA